MNHDTHEMPAPAHGSVSTEDLPGGLAISRYGYTLALGSTELATGPDIPLRFRILDSAGQPLENYAAVHEQELHLIVVRRDLSGFQHVHPVLQSGGVWHTLVALRPGVWRVFADFQPSGAGESITLGADVSVAGDYSPIALPGALPTASVEQYEVRLNGSPAAGQPTMLTLNISLEGQPVVDLQPYLGAYGHLVALRAGDLAYLHVHPAGEPADGHTQPGPDVTFHLTPPTSGVYRLYLDFQHGGRVRTAEFTLQAPYASAHHSPASAGHHPQ